MVNKTRFCVLFDCDIEAASVSVSGEFMPSGTNHESEGGHTFTNWRKYLSIFTPLLFK